MTKKKNWSETYCPKHLLDVTTNYKITISHSKLVQYNTYYDFALFRKCEYTFKVIHMLSHFEIRNCV